MINNYIRKIRFLGLLLSLLAIVSLASAQEVQVSGKVTDSGDGSGIPGANILVKGTTNGTISDIDGNYKLSAPGDATLVFSFVGYISQEIALNGRSTVDIALETDVTQLSEVVVIGYGTQEKKEITSAVASISEKDFNAGNVTSPTQLLTGKVAGLSIVRAGGDINEDPQIRLRGLSTFGANSSPLIVIDGVIGASLDNIDPSDIATMDVLKDGSGAAIYGARGSSGVILVTTKSGQGVEGTIVNFNSYVTVDQVANSVDVLSADEFVANGGTDFGSDTDWFDELTSSAVSYTANLSIAGSLGANTSYRASTSYRDNEGIIEGINFDRINVRFGVNHAAFDGKLRFSINASSNSRSEQSIEKSAFRYAAIYNPTAPIFDDIETDVDGGFFQRPLFDFLNPVALAKQRQFEEEKKSTLTSYRVEYEVLSGLTLAANYSQDRVNEEDKFYASRLDLAGGAGNDGVAARNSYDKLQTLFEATASYNTELVDGLDFTALMGASTQSKTETWFGLQVKKFLFDDQGFDNLGFASLRQGQNTAAFSGKRKDELNSIFGRVNLNYQGTFFLSASARREAYSGFGENEKAGIFPAVSIGVELTEVADLGPFSSLKLRGSFGITGNLPPNPQLALALFDAGGVIDLDGNPLTVDDIWVAPVQATNPNPNLKWETKQEIDFGVDYALLNGKITGTMDYYTRNISDLLYQLPVSIGSPSFFEPGGINTAPNTWANIAELTAAGFEFVASYNGLELGSNILWTPTINFTIYDKTVIDDFTVGALGFSEIRLATPGSPGQNNNEIIRNRVGETLGNMYGPVFLGIDEQGGNLLSSTDPDDWGVIGNGLPDAEFGFSNSFQFGNLDFNFFLRGAIGHDIYNSYRGFYENRDAGSNTWNSVNTKYANDNLTGTPTFSSLYIEDATFLRLDNAQVGYNFPLTNSSFSKVRLYISAQNLFTITSYSGIDPEVRYVDSELGEEDFNRNLSPGLERRDTYFTTRSFSFGVNLSF